MKKQRGAIIGSRTKYYEEGEKTQSCNNTIHKLQLSDNKVTQDPQKYFYF